MKDPHSHVSSSTRPCNWALVNRVEQPQGTNIFREYRILRLEFNRKVEQSGPKINRGLIRVVLDFIKPNLVSFRYIINLISINLYSDLYKVSFQVDLH